MNPTQKAMLFWGVICLVGFGIFQFWQTTIDNMNLTWLVLIVIGLIALFHWHPQATSHPTLLIWAALVILGLAVSWLWSSGLLPVGGVIAPFISIWLLLLFVGFFATGKYTKERAWYGAALLQLIVLFGVWANIPWVLGFSFFLLGIVSGVPLILMSFKY